MRATRILTQRPDRAVLALAELCREREDELHRAPRSSSPAPRSMSASRAPFPPPVQAAPWRSQSQAPYSHAESGGRSRQSEGDPNEFSAQDLWLSAQGSNLGGVGPGSLGLQGFEPPASASASTSGSVSGNGRGRDTVSRGLETPGGAYRNTRRAVSAYDDGAGSGSISAPLSPHRLYAQLEMGKGPQLNQANWQSSMIGYDPRQHSTAGMPVGSSSHRGQPRSASQVPGTAVKSVGAERGGLTSPMPTFAPFSPAAPTSSLRPLNGEMASYISPSTLLSPPQASANLPAGSATSAIDGLANSFDKMGVNPPGQGPENPTEARKADADKSATKTDHKPATPIKKKSI
jgi:terminal uridylyltransferase